MGADIAVGGNRFGFGRGYPTMSSQKPPHKFELSPDHYCGHRLCCSTFLEKRHLGEDEATYKDKMKLKAKSINHLPTCHQRCFIAERDKLLLQKETSRWEALRGPEEDWDLPLCHRCCYADEVWHRDHPTQSKKRYVPQNRTIGEQLEIYQLGHWVEKWWKPRNIESLESEKPKHASLLPKWWEKHREESAKKCQSILLR